MPVFRAISEKIHAYKYLAPSAWFIITSLSVLLLVLLWLFYAQNAQPSKLLREVRLNLECQGHHYFSWLPLLQGFFSLAGYQKSNQNKTCVSHDSILGQNNWAGYNAVQIRQQHQTTLWWPAHYIFYLLLLSLLCECWTHKCCFSCVIIIERINFLLGILMIVIFLEK